MSVCVTWEKVMLKSPREGDHQKRILLLPSLAVNFLKSLNQIGCAEDLLREHFLYLLLCAVVAPFVVNKNGSIVALQGCFLDSQVLLAKKLLNSENLSIYRQNYSVKVSNQIFQNTFNLPIGSKSLH